MNEFKVFKNALEREYKRVEYVNWENLNESEIVLRLAYEDVNFEFKDGKLVSISVDRY